MLRDSRCGKGGVLGSQSGTEVVELYKTRVRATVTSSQARDHLFNTIRDRDRVSMRQGDLYLEAHSQPSMHQEHFHQTSNSQLSLVWGQGRRGRGMQTAGHGHANKMFYQNQILFCSQI